MLNTEALNYQLHYTALFGLAYCSSPESDTFCLVGNGGGRGTLTEKLHSNEINAVMIKPQC